MNKKFIEECEEAYWKSKDRLEHTWEKYDRYSFSLWLCPNRIK